MSLFNGWHLPDGDGYFVRFCQGELPKRNGFQKEHLDEAFKHVKRWRVAIDVGAHVGFWTRDMAQRFNTVFAFEPAEDTFECLLKNTSDLSNVVAAQQAIGEEVGFCVVKDDAKRLGNTGSRFVRRQDEGVMMMTLDSFKFPCCDFLKVDVEGYELQVLQGAEELIEEHHPVVIMECDKNFSFERYGVGRDEAMMFLRKREYEEVARMRPDRVFVHP